MTDEENNTNGKPSAPYKDPVTFGLSMVIGSGIGFLNPDIAPLSIAAGLVLGMTLPFPLSRWIHF